jgi:hypothetical protein
MRPEGTHAHTHTYTHQMVILKAKITIKILPICVVNIKILIKEMPV